MPGVKNRFVLERGWSGAYSLASQKCRAFLFEEEKKKKKKKGTRALKYLPGQKERKKHKINYTPTQCS